jgi:Mycothiol maleylpyruvate isomerase N-terminal domain
MAGDRKRELLRLEDERWGELRAVFDRLSFDQILEPGFTPDWTVKDLLAHLGSWMAEAVDVLEQIRFGTWGGWDRDVDEVNAEFYEAQKDVPLPVVRSELAASRTRMLQEWDALPEITSDAEEWFRESGPVHYVEHLHDLRAFVDRVSARSSHPCQGGQADRP